MESEKSTEVSEVKSEVDENQLVVLKEKDLLKIFQYILNQPAKDVADLLSIFSTVRRAEEKHD